MSESNQELLVSLYDNVQRAEKEVSFLYAIVRDGAVVRQGESFDTIKQIEKLLSAAHACALELSNRAVFRRESTTGGKE